MLHPGSDSRNGPRSSEWVFGSQIVSINSVNDIVNF